MRRVIEAIFKDGEVRSLEPLDLSDDTRLRILIEQADGADAGADVRRQSDPLATIYELAADAGPSDLAVNLDHYLYGLPMQK